MIAVRKPSLFMLAVRVVVVTVLVTLLAFAVALLLGIVGMALANAVHGGGISMAHAYRNIALPVASGVLILAFVAMLTLEIKQYRRQRAAAREYQRAA